MSVNYYRIVSFCKEDVDCPVYLDAPVDTDGSIITKAWLFGCMGKNGTDRFFPFVGRLDKDEPSPRFPFLFDFGTDLDEADRYYWSNISMKKVQKGEQFTVRMPSENEGRFVEMIYHVKEIIDLAKQQQVS